MSQVSAVTVNHIGIGNPMPTISARLAHFPPKEYLSKPLASPKVYTYLFSSFFPNNHIMPYIKNKKRGIKKPMKGINNKKNTTHIDNTIFLGNKSLKYYLSFSRAREKKKK